MIYWVKDKAEFVIWLWLLQCRQTDTLPYISRQFYINITHKFLTRCNFYKPLWMLFLWAKFLVFFTHEKWRFSSSIPWNRCFDSKQLYTAIASGSWIKCKKWFWFNFSSSLMYNSNVASIKFPLGFFEVRGWCFRVFVLLMILFSLPLQGKTPKYISSILIKFSRNVLVGHQKNFWHILININ